MFTVSIVSVMVLAVLGYGLILFSESNSGRDVTTKKVNPWGAAAEIIGGLILFASGIFVGAALLPEDPRNTLRYFAHPEELRKKIEEVVGKSTVSSVPDVDPPDVSLVNWDTSTRMLTFPAPPTGHFWVLAYDGKRIPLPSSGSQKIPEATLDVEIYLQRKSPAGASPAVTFATTSPTGASPVTPE